MYRISDQQIDFILNDISARGVEMESLQQNLLDHICCIIEHDLEENGDFESFYQKTVKTFYKDALWEIEEETLQLLIFKNYYTMKKIMIASGTFSAAVMSIGIFFKFMHWPGASLLIILGIAISSLVFLPLLFTLKSKEKQNVKDKLILGIGILAGVLISLAILFKVMHWPGANLMGVSFVGLMVLVYIPVYFFTGIKNPESKVNTIVSTIIMIMGCGLFLTLVNTRPYLQEDSNVISNQALQESYISISAQVRSLSFTAYTTTPITEPNDLAKNCNAICDRIETLKLKLINITEATSVRNINYYELGKLDNFDMPTHILFNNANNANETPMPYSELLTLKGDLMNLNTIAGKSFTTPVNLIDLSEKKNPRTGVAESWEIHNFYHAPLGNVLRNLTQLQINIRVIQLLKKDK
ncbi:MAG: hypothetical protein V4506_04380 [Bacteroidota bacterium]